MMRIYGVYVCSQVYLCVCDCVCMSICVRVLCAVNIQGGGPGCESDCMYLQDSKSCEVVTFTINSISAYASKSQLTAIC